MNFDIGTTIRFLFLKKKLSLFRWVSIALLFIISDVRLFYILHLFRIGKTSNLFIFLKEPVIIISISVQLCKNVHDQDN
jgi:hypothetical protein